MSWDRATLQARVADAGRRVRHAAGSPDPTEVAAYVGAVREALGGSGPEGRTVVVLGATPELRRAFSSAGASVVAVDRSALAWEAYGDWNPGAELRVRGDWGALDRLLSRPVHAVVGDGVVGNVDDLAACRALLATVRSVLAPGGVCVLRQALVPTDLTPSDVTSDRLLADHRADLLDDAEFGFAMRLLAHLDCCWDRTTGILDGARLVDETARWADDAGLSPAERAAIARYAYRGRNLIPAEADWRAAVAGAGFARRRVPLEGRHWYRYYPVELCRPG